MNCMKKWNWIWIGLGIVISELGFAVNPMNPFQIPFEGKTELTNEDFIEVQRQLRQINLHHVLHHNWRDDGSYSNYMDFWIRCSRGTRQEFISLERGFYPKQELIKIGEGGNRCIVCCAPYRIVEEDPGTRARLAGKLAEALSQTGFNGYFLSLIGGFPNPTGKEICYAGVPYSFKIFMMLEAYKRGFTNVIWIDSACLPLNDPTPLFNEIERTEALLYMFPCPPDSHKYIFESTRRILKATTGSDVLKINYVVSIVFGLKMDSERVRKLIEQYYSLVDMGSPFLSCFPEEFVLSAIIGRPEFNSWTKSAYMGKLFARAAAHERDSEDRILAARKANYFFYQQKH